MHFVRSTRFATFPDYLVVQLKKYVVGADWTPKKLDVSIDMTNHVDINFLRGYGTKPEEELIPEIEEASTSSVKSEIVVCL